eukprot:EG_transcript_22873
MTSLFATVVVLLAMVTGSLSCLCNVTSWNVANCSGTAAADIQWVYPIGSCVSDGSTSRKAVSCTQLYDYPNTDCSGTPWLSFTSGQCLGIYGITSTRLICQDSSLLWMPLLS